MTMQTFSANFSAFSTDAAFRAWGSGCSTALQACGLTLTSDTGMINWTTVTKPTATNTKAGYEVYKFADSLQSTKPVYIRFDYGSAGQTSGNGPCIWATVGTGSNGSGTITGLVWGPQQLNPDANSLANNASPCQFTHSTSNGYLLANFGIAYRASAGAINDVTTAGILILERTKDSTGAPTGDGLTITYCQNQATTTVVWNQLGLNFTTSSVVTPTGSTLPLIGPLNTGMTLTTGSVSALYKQYSWIGSLFYAVGCLGFFNTDQTNSATFTATPVGSTSHTYFCWINGTKSANSANSTNICMAWAWEN